MTMGLVNAARQIESYGMGPDRQLAHISPDEAQLMDTLQGGRRVNSMTGLPQYGMFGKILKAVARVAATTVGFMYGGPLGAAAASAAATKLTGGSWKQALTSGAISGVTAGLGSYAQGTRGLGNIATTSGNTLAANAARDAVITSAAGPAATLNFAPTAAQSAAMAASPTLSPTFGQTLTNAASLAAANPVSAVSMALPSATSAFAPTPVKAPAGDLSFMTPDPSFGGGTLRDAGTRLASKGVTQYGGFDIPRNSTAPLGIARPGENPMEQNFGGFASGGNVQPTGLMGASQLGYVNAKRGGTIRGPGDGKSDDIPALLSNNEHVIDAATVADAGNGDSDAGHKVFEKIKQKIRKNAGRKNPKRPSPKQRGLGSLMRAA